MTRFAGIPDNPGGDGPHADHPQPRDPNERGLSEAIEKAFESRSAQSGQDSKFIAEMTSLAESIQRSLTNEAPLIGEGYRVLFATTGTGADTVLRMNPAGLNIVRKDGQMLCRITVLDLQNETFEVEANTNIVRSRSIPTVWRRNGLSTLLEGLATVVAASVSEVDYLRRKGPVEARKFMPGTI